MELKSICIELKISRRVSDNRNGIQVFPGISNFAILYHKIFSKFRIILNFPDLTSARIVLRLFEWYSFEWHVLIIYNHPDLSRIINSIDLIRYTCRRTQFRWIIINPACNFVVDRKRRMIHAAFTSQLGCKWLRHFRRPLAPRCLQHLDHVP